MALFGIFHPISLVKSIFEIIVLPEALLEAVHPLALIDNVLSLVVAHRLTQQSASAVLLTLFELAPVLQILLCEVVNPAALDILASPCSVIAVAVWKHILKFCDFRLNQLLRRESLACIDFREFLCSTFPGLLLNDRYRFVCLLFWAAHGVPSLLLFIRRYSYSFRVGFHHFTLFGLLKLS